jgi:hypothetical protein
MSLELLPVGGTEKASGNPHARRAPFDHGGKNASLAAKHRIELALLRIFAA